MRDVMQPLLGGLDPRPEPVALPSGRFHFYKDDPCRLHEQDAQVVIAPLRYFAEDGAVPGRDLPPGDSTSGGVARMRGSSARRTRCPCRTAIPRSSRMARI